LAPLDAADGLLRALASRGWEIILANSASSAELSALRRAIDADDVILGTAGADDVDEGNPAAPPLTSRSGNSPEYRPSHFCRTVLGRVTRGIPIGSSFFLHASCVAWVAVLASPHQLSDNLRRGRRRN
jgi:hypothetical protein